MSFWDHLEELRARILRSAAYVAAGTLVGWVIRDTRLLVLRWPAEAGARAAHVENFTFRIFEPAGGLVLMLQASLVAGIILASPLLLWEMWGFFEPALEERERRWAVPFLLLATFLFLAGVAFCYVIAPACFAYFFNFNKGLGVQPELTLAPYLYFLMRFMLVLGIGFELPLVLMIAAVAGVIDSALMTRYWRQGTVIVFVVAAIITPTTDPVTCTIVGIPMAGLYLLSISLVKLVERVMKKEGERAETTEPADDDPYHLYDDRADRQDGLNGPPSDPPEA